MLAGVDRGVACPNAAASSGGGALEKKGALRKRIGYSWSQRSGTAGTPSRAVGHRWAAVASGRAALGRAVGHRWVERLGTAEALWRAVERSGTAGAQWRAGDHRWRERSGTAGAEAGLRGRADAAAWAGPDRGRAPMGLTMGMFFLPPYLCATAPRPFCPPGRLA